MIPRSVVRGRPNPTHVKFPTRLRKARKSAGLTFTTLAERAGMTTATTSTLERGANVPRVDTVEKLARALNLPPSLLAFGVDHPWDQRAGLLYKGLPARLREVRQVRELSMRELERRVGMADNLVRNTEKGHSSPTISTVEKLASALGVSSAWLAYGLGPMDAPPRHAARRTTSQAADKEAPCVG